MLKIRLRRAGARNEPTYRVVVSDARERPRGRFVEVLGYYDPRPNPATVRIDVERAEAWMRKGARPSPTVRRLLQQVRSGRS